jgi:hypothetical protein
MAVIQNISKKLTELVDKLVTTPKVLYVSDTNVRTSIDAYAIYAIENTTFTTLHVGTVGTSSTGLSSKTLIAGQTWKVPIKGTVTLAGGSVLIYLN